MEQQTMTKPVELTSASDPAPRDARWIRRDGPFWLAIALAAGGLVYLLVGRLTIVPWIADERQTESVRHVWLALSRHLPDIGAPSLARFGFWLLVALVAALCVALMVAASAAGRDDEPDSGARA